MNKDAYSNIVNIILNFANIEYESNLKTTVIINSGKMIIKPNEIQFLDQPNDYFLYLYSLKYEKNGNLDYIPEIVFNYDTERNRNKHFGELNKGGNIDEFYKDETTSIWDKYSRNIGKAYLLKKNENKNIEKLDNKEINNDININNLETNLSYSISLYKEYLNINIELNEKIVNKKDLFGENYYLVNRKYMIELEKYLHFAEINNVINNFNFKIDLDDLDNQNNMEKIKEKLSNNTIIELSNLNEKKFDEILNIKNLYDLSQNEYILKNKEELKYYKDCQIINEKIYENLSKIDKNFIHLRKYKSITNCILGDKKAFLFLNNKVINIGYINQNNIFTIELLINSHDNNVSLELVEVYKNKGYKFIETFISLKSISFGKKDLINKPAKIYLISNNEQESQKSEEKQINEEEDQEINEEKEENNINQNKIIDERLKILILLCISQKKYENKKIIHNLEEIYLLNNKWLEQFKYDKIQDKINSINISDLNDTNKIINDVINKLDNKLIEEINNSFLKSQNNNISCNAESETLNLLDKEIFIYKDFILVNKQINELLKKHFNIYVKRKSEFYLSHINTDIIVINNSKQNTIFIGKYNFEAKIYNIEYILEFINENYLKNELNKLPNKSLKIYLKYITIFNEKNSNDYISPIIDNNEILGNCYKYNPNFTDYSSCINYIEYLQNDKIKYFLK